MRRRTLRLIAAKELLDTLRDRRTLFVSLVLPLLLYPALLLGLVQVLGATQRNLAAESQRVLVDGAGIELTELLRQEKLEPVDARSAGVRDEVRGDLERLAAGEEDARARLRSTLDEQGWSGALLCGRDFERLVRSSRQTSAEFLFDPTDEPSKVARAKVERALDRYREQKRAELRERFPDLEARLLFAEEPIRIESLEVASSSQKGAYSFAPLLGMLVVVMALTGAFYPAVDLAAGEKERGTLETLLVAPVTRTEIVLGKFVAIWVIAVLTALLNLFVMGLTFSKVAGMVSGAGSVRFDLPFTAMAAVVVIIVPTAALFSAVALALSSFATSYKEGQHYMSPLFLVALPLAMVSLLPNVEIGYALAVVPVANVVLLVKAMLLGGETLGPAVVAAGATAAYALGALWAAVAVFKRESVLFRSGAGRGHDALSLRAAQEGIPGEGRAILLFFVVLALMFFLSSDVTTRREAILAFLKAQLLAVLAPTLLFAWRGRIDWRRTFALRGVQPRVVPAVLLAAAGTLVLVVALYTRVLPSPRAEGFEHIVRLLQGLPRWLHLVLFAVLPPICEELLCRGFLLSALRPRLGTKWAVVATAALFAILHLDVSRFPATFLAGLMLGFVRVRTGSLFMAILFHMVFNAVIATPELAVLLAAPSLPLVAVAAAVVAGAVVFLEWNARRN